MGQLNTTEASQTRQTLGKNHSLESGCYKLLRLPGFPDLSAKAPAIEHFEQMWLALRVGIPFRVILSLASLAW